MSRHDIVAIVVAVAYFLMGVAVLVYVLQNLGYPDDGPEWPIASILFWPVVLALIISVETAKRKFRKFVDAESAKCPVVTGKELAKIDQSKVRSLPDPEEARRFFKA